MHESININFCVIPQGKSSDNQLMLKRGGKRATNIETESGQGETGSL